MTLNLQDPCESASVIDHAADDSRTSDNLLTIAQGMVSIKAGFKPSNSVCRIVYMCESERSAAADNTDIDVVNLCSPEYFSAERGEWAMLEKEFENVAGLWSIKIIGAIDGYPS